LDQVDFYKCANCGYEFLAKSKDAICPRCKGRKLEDKGIGALAGLDD